MELIILIGLQASGKSTFVRERFMGSHTIVSKDNFRHNRKNELLLQRGINFNDLPVWQRRGTAIYWRRVEEEGLNPKTGEKVRSIRRRLFVDEDLPRGKELDEFLHNMLDAEA